MSFFLFAKIGNSTIEVLETKKIRLFPSTEKGLQALAKRSKHHRLIFVSVVPALSRRLHQLLGKSAKEVKLKDIPLALPYSKTLGTDRALKVWGYSQKTTQSFVIVDFGTATTVEFFDRERGYLGGWICPGFQLMADALKAGTAQLPQISFSLSSKPPSKNGGQDTLSSMALGIREAQEGILLRAQILARQTFKTSSFQIVITGGFSRLLPKQSLRPGVKIRPLLLLESLKQWAEQGPLSRVQESR